MRRILVLAFAVAATFTVLANNFIPVSAPTAFGELNYEPAGPSDAARLSEISVATTVVPVPNSPASPVTIAARPDLTAHGLHVSSADPMERTVAPSPSVIASVPRFVHAQAYSPLNSFTKQRLAALPRPTVIPDAIAAVIREHKASTSIDAAVAERFASDAERVSILENSSFESVGEHLALTLGADGMRDRTAASTYVARVDPKPIPLTAEATKIFRSVNSIPLAELPAIVPSTTVLADAAAAHRADAALATAMAERAEFTADVARIERPAVMVVNAAYQAPDSIFHRARFVVEPYAPVAANTLAVANDEHSQNSVTEQAIERETASVDNAIVQEPAMVTTLIEAPVAEFERAPIAELPQAPVAVENLAAAQSHSPDEPIFATERDSDETSADAAPRQSYVPSFLETLVEVPAAVFQRIGLLAAPVAPATTESLTASTSDHVATNSQSTFAPGRDATMPDTAKVSESTPLSITASTAMSANMLKPMSAGPLVDAPMLNENAVASTGYVPTSFDRMIDTPDVPEAVLTARPVTISGKAEFSNDLLRPMNAPINPFQKLDKAEVLSAIQQTNNYCDPNFVGPPIRFSQTVELKLDDLLRQLHQRFGVNFIVGKGVAELPMNIKAGSIPWNVLLKSQLFISGVRARCIDANTIELVENADLPSLQDQADVETRFVKLKFLQRTGGGTVDLANRSQGGQSGNQGGGCGGNNQGGTSGSIQGGGGGQGGGQQGQTVGQLTNNKFDKLIVEIEKILGLRSMQESSVGSGSSSGGGGGSQQQREAVRSNRFVTQIPGRNILAIRATKEEHELIDQILVRADRPPFQVVIKGLVYTANQDKLRDIGVSTTITGGTADGRTNGGIFGDTLGTGTLFDFSTVIGTFDFNVQATAFQQNGVISVKSRPFATVIDGLCTTLDVGRQLPIVIDSTLGGQGDVVFVNAANNLAVTPYVIDDDQGNPVAVTLELRLTANDIDSSVTSRGVPAISARSIQTQLLLDENKTAILGGFTVDSDSRTRQKTPGLGDIPIIGELFKRRIRDTRVNRLYFAVAVDILPYPEPIRPVDVPGADPQPPSITPEQKKRADAAEPKQVKGP